MAAFQAFNTYTKNQAEGVHDLAGHALKIVLSNVAPSPANVVLADIAQIAAGNGYVAGGQAVSVVSSSQSGGVYSLALADVTFTASGGPLGPFRYVVLYDDTPGTDPLIGWWDHGSEVTLAPGAPYIVGLAGHPLTMAQV